MRRYDRLNFNDSKRDDLKVTSDIIYRTEFNRTMRFQRYTVAAALIFFLHFNVFAGSITVRPKLSSVDAGESLRLRYGV